MAFWRKTGDNLKNGTVLGIIVALAMVWGNNVYSWLLISVPPLWTQTIPLWLYLIVLGALIGYFVDRK